MNKIKKYTWIIVCSITLVFTPVFYADDSDGVVIDKDTQRAINRGLEWLAKNQRADGSWSDSRFPHSTAISSFALLAFMSQGHLPNQGKYGPEVTKATRYILASAREDGYLLGARGGNMYSHGLAELALSQLYGMTGDPEVRKTLKKAVELTVRAQAPSGGWRYEPVPSGDDISVTIGQVMALRGAKDSGIQVPDRTIKRALEYINTCYDSPTGGYTYQPRNRAPGFARTAAGICVLKLCGDYDKRIDRSIDFLKRSMRGRPEHLWYGHYYACHALYQVGGQDWKNYYDRVRVDLLNQQSPDGSWSAHTDHNSAGPVYQTAIAIIILSVPGHYLPIFQR